MPQLTADKEDHAFWEFNPEGGSEECYEMLIAQARLLGNTTIVPFEEISSLDISKIQPVSRRAMSPRNLLHLPQSSKRKSISISKQQAEKEEEMLALFKLPDDESLLQYYGCVMKHSLSSVPGYLLIFRYHFCFQPSVGSALTKIPIAEVASMTKRRTAILLPNALTIITQSKQKYSFHSVLKRNEAYSIMYEQLEQVRSSSKQS